MYCSWSSHWMNGWMGNITIRFSIKKWTFQNFKLNLCYYLLLLKIFQAVLKLQILTFLFFCLLWEFYQKWNWAQNKNWVNWIFNDFFKVSPVLISEQSNRRANCAIKIVFIFFRINNQQAKFLQKKSVFVALIVSK